MSILEDLDLMDLLDELPGEANFDLDDILFEFSTPGLFTAPENEQKEEPVPKEAKAPAEVSIPEESVEKTLPEESVPESIPEEPMEPVLPEAVEIIEEASAPVIVAEEPVAEPIITDEIDVIPEIMTDFDVEEESDHLHSDDALFGDSLGLCDILYEFGTPVDDEGVKLYTPSAQTVDIEDDIKVYNPETKSAALVSEESQNTVLFDALEPPEHAQPLAAASAQQKAPGFFAKAAALVMGLFASKKPAEPAVPVESTTEDDMLSLFMQDTPVAEEEVPAIDLQEATDVDESVVESELAAVVSEEDTVLDTVEEAVVPEIEQEVIAETEAALVMDEAVCIAKTEETADEDDSNAEICVDSTYFETVPEAEDESTAFIENCGGIPTPELLEESVPVVEEVSVSTEEDVQFIDTPNIDDILFDIGLSDVDFEHADPVESTIVFEAINLSEQSAPAEVQPAAAPAQQKAPGFFAKAAALVMGLFASKKPAEPVPPVEQPAEENVQSQFTQTFSVLDEEIPVIELQTDAAEDFAVPAAEQEAPVPVEELSTEETSSEQIAPVEENNEGDLNISDILFELSNFEDTDIPDLSALSFAEEVRAPETDDIKVYTSEEDVKVYVPEEISIEIPADEPENTDILTESTIVFDAIDLSEQTVTAEAQPAAAVSAQQKAPGFFTKAAALVMGLFASKKPAKTVAAPQPVSIASAEEDPFANLADLFSASDSDELSDMDELMLELEMQAEREAELEAEAAARDAAERLAQEEAQKALELEAQRLAQEEADAEAEANRLKAEEEARMKAETDALLKQLQAEEEERQAQAEDELFEWIEAAEKRRESAARMESVLEEPSIPEQSPVSEPAFVLEAPVLEDIAESATPKYDFAAVPMPSETQEYAAPQMDISFDEEVPEEVGDLLEMPDVEQSTAETTETAEEAAARKKREEDNLRYVPEESTAKTVTSHIGKRFGAAFTAFTESSDDSDSEEDLGPELPAGKAYRFFNRYIDNYRFRLRISAILCVILGWISLGLPVFGSLKNPAAAAAMCLMMLLTVMLAGADILAVGVRNLLKKRPSIHSLVAISCLASVIDAAVIILTKGTAGYLPFCGVSAISMCFAIYGSLLYCRSQRLNFKTLDRANEPMTISVDYGIVDPETATVYRSPGHPEGYIHHSEEEDLSETVYGIIAPILIPAIPVMTVIAALFSNGFGDFFHIMAAMFAAAASFGALIAFPLPYFLVQRDLYATKAAIAGWAGAREIGRVSTMIVSDRDLFPDETVSIKSVRIVDNVPPQLTLSYICSVIHHSGSCLVPAFTQLAENNDCEILEVENFQCHEAGGLSAEIGPDSVLVASHSYMKLQGFRIPARKKDSENALFLAVNGHVIAYIIVDYKPIKSVRAGLQSALRGNVEMIFAARDFNVTPLLISKKFKSPTETLRFPSYNQRYEITSQVNSESAACAAVVYRKSFYSYAVVVEKARYLYNSVSWGVVLSAVSSILGVLLMFFMAITGAGAAVTVGRLLVFMLLWLIPTLALTVSITK